MTKAILFDLFETLVTEYGTLQPRASSLGSALGLNGAAFRAAWKVYRPLVLRGQTTFGEALARIGAKQRTTITAPTIQRVCSDRSRAKSSLLWRIDPDVLALCRGLHEQGIRLGVVSNCFAEDIEAWSTCELAPYFAATAFSFEVGVAKPDSGIYLEAVRRLDVAPADVTFIGNGADDELAGAVRAGLRAAQAVWFMRSGADRESVADAPRVARPLDVIQLVTAGG